MLTRLLSEYTVNEVPGHVGNIVWNFWHNPFFVIFRLQSLTSEPPKPGETGHMTRGPPVWVVLMYLYQKNRGFASSFITWIAGFICHSELLQAVNKLWHSHAYHKLKFPLLLAPQGLLARWSDVCCMRCIIGWNENVCNRLPCSNTE